MRPCASNTATEKSWPSRACSEYAVFCTVVPTSTAIDCSAPQITPSVMGSSVDRVTTAPAARSMVASYRPRGGSRPRSHVSGASSPIVRRDRYHRWATSQLAEETTPLLACEAVISEACFLVRRSRGGSRAGLELLERRAVRVVFHLNEHLPHITRLMSR